MRQKRRSSRDDEDGDETLSENLAEVTERLDDLTRQLARVARASKRPARDEDDADELDWRPERHERPERPRNGTTNVDDRSSDRVAEAIARLDRRLDQVIAEGRVSAADRRPAFAHPTPQTASAPVHARPAAPVAAPAQQPAAGPNNWAMEISARQRALDGDSRPPAPAHVAVPPAPAQAMTPQPVAPQVVAADLSGLENQLRGLTSQIAAMHRPYEEALNALRGDLAEIGRALTDALPRRAVEALEHEVRALSERVDHIRHSSSGADGSMLAGLEHGLAEVRDTLRGLTPAESLVGVDEAVRGLSRKIDQISVSQQDPAQFHQLEHAIGSLRGLVSNVASDGALAQLAAEVHALAGKFERAAATGGADAIAALDQRIATLVETGRHMPAQLETAIRTLTSQLERSQLSQGDHLALRTLEDRIVKLFEKLDASDARLGSLGAIERGIADLLVAFGEMRNARPARAVAPEPAPAHAEQPAHLPQAAQLHPPQQSQALPQVLPPEAAPTLAPAPPAAPVAVAPPPPAPPARPRPPAPPRAEPRRPIDPHLPPDTPIEPGAGAPRVKPGSPAARIAASEAALGPARPQAPETGGRSAAIAAARSAAKISAEASTPKPKPQARIKDPAREPDPVVLDAEDAVGPAAAPSSLRARFAKHGKTLLIATSVVVIVLGVLQTAMDFLASPSAPVAVSPPASAPAPAVQQPATRAPETPARPAAPSRSMPSPDGPLPPPADADPEPTGQVRDRTSFFDTQSILSNLPRSADITGSIGRAPAGRPAASAPQTPAPAPAAHAAAVGAIPASVGPNLRSALAANSPAAEYELGLRYSEGRGVAQDMDEASRWFARAADGGFAPAQFRLAGLNEKGDGVKKDLQAARRLYTAAAEKGHAKAMHNLAVLHAEGIDGKPDYRVASHWFRRAAAHGVGDSQYNLAILYARGIGLTQNLAESYKWFSLAAAKGDQDAAKKRDDVAARLDKATLSAARLAVQTFTAEPEPDEAVNLKVPPGGWDRVSTAAQPTKPRTKGPSNPR